MKRYDDVTICAVLEFFFLIILVFLERFFNIVKDIHSLSSNQSICTHISENCYLFVIFETKERNEKFSSDMSPVTMRTVSTLGKQRKKLDNCYYSSCKEKKLSVFFESFHRGRGSFTRRKNYDARLKSMWPCRRCNEIFQTGVTFRNRRNINE
jgi:hypothetical protein